MRTLVVVAALLGSVPSAGAQEKSVSIAVTDLAPRGVDPVAAKALTTEVTNTLAGLGVFSVISAEDIKRLLTLEATRQACTGDADAACLAEIGGALGVDYLIYGEVSKVGDVFSISLNLLDAAEATAVARANRKVDDPALLLTETEGLTKVLVRALLEENRGFLVLESREVGARVEIDGRLIGVTPLPGRMELPMGPHDVVIDKGGFVTWARTVEVAPGAVSVESVVLVPNQNFIEDYESAAQTTRTVAWVTGGVAALALGTAAVLRIVDDAAFDDSVSRRHLEVGGACEGAGAGDLCPTALGRANGVLETVDRLERRDTIALGAAIGGAVSGVVSLLLFATGDSPGRYAAYSSAKASAGLQLFGGPGGLGLRGQF